MARLPSVDWLGWTAVGLVLAVAALSLSVARARVQYELDGARQAAWIELRLLFGLWHRHWRVPEEHGRAPAPGPSHFGHRAQRVMVPGRDPTDLRPSKGRSPAWRGVDYLRGRVRLSALHLDVRVGTGDAALTALAVGGAHALIGTALALLPSYFHLRGLRPDVRVHPDHAETRLQARADCIAATRLGHLMVAVALAWWVSHLPPDRRT